MSVRALPFSDEPLQITASLDRHICPAPGSSIPGFYYNAWSRLSCTQNLFWDDISIITVLVNLELN